MHLWQDVAVDGPGFPKTFDGLVRGPVQQVVVEPEGVEADRVDLRGRLMVSLHQVIAHQRPFARQPLRRDELRLRAWPRRRVACAHRVVGAALARGIPDLVATQRDLGPRGEWVQAQAPAAVAAER